MESTQNKTRCPHSKKCGGCQLQNLDYKEQLAHKERTCIRLLGKFCRVEPIIGMENPYHYRNKVQAAFGTTRAGRIISGIYQSSTHNIVAVDSCMTEDEIADRIIVDIRRLLRNFKMTTYNEVTGRGFLRHVLVKRGFQTGEVMVVLVTGTPIFPARNNFTRALLRQHRTIAEASAVESPIRQETIGFPAHFFARAHNFKPPGRACQPEADSPMRT